MSIKYYSLHFIAWLFSKMPFALLHFFSRCFYLVIYQAFGYRKKVVRTNLTNSFPEKSNAEILELERAFYKYFCDLLFESIVLLTISSKRLKERVSIEGFELFDQLTATEQSCIAVMGHQGNWEWAGARYAVEGRFPQLYAIYHPLKNKAVDRLICHIRTRSGNRLYKMRSAAKGMYENREKLTTTAFIADQTPPKKSAYWTSFMQQDTPVFLGTAKLSKKLNLPIVYIAIRLKSRSKYHLKAELLVKDPSTYTVEEITRMHIERLEKDIHNQPHIWLWSHRRWKQRREK